MVRMAEEGLGALREAAATLEHPGLAARLGNIAGKPIELVGRALPGHRRAWWCSGELRLHRPLPGGGACALHGAPARTALRQECCPSCIRAVLVRSRRLSAPAIRLRRAGYAGERSVPQVAL